MLIESRCVSESCENADVKGAGPEQPSEVNCNGHLAADQRPSQWRDEDQHNGNAQPSEEERNNESPVYAACNGSADAEEPRAETEESGARGSGGAERFLPPELEHSLNQEQGEDGYNCGYTSEDHLRNGQSTKGDASGNDAPENRRWLSMLILVIRLLPYRPFISLLLPCDRQTDSRIPAR